MNRSLSIRAENRHRRPTVQPPDHAHHWRIAEPDGPTSPGHCVNCGAEREFRNWDDQTATDPRVWKLDMMAAREAL